MTTISIITPTYRRPDLLARAARSVLSQDVEASLEYLVVNDAPDPLPSAAWMDDPRVRILATHQAERSVARNTGAQHSTGRWLHFLDDDDYLLPGALAALLQAARIRDAVLVYGGYEIHDVQKKTTHVIRPDLEEDAFPAFVSDEMLPLGPSWFQRDAFFAVGAFDPRMVQAEDADLYRRLAFHGATAGTSTVVAALRVNHPRTSLTHWKTNRTRWRRGLENCLDRPETLESLLRRTQHSPYWRGRCARKYLTSALYHLLRGRLATARLRRAGWQQLRAGYGGSAAFRRGLAKGRREHLPFAVRHTLPGPGLQSRE